MMHHRDAWALRGSTRSVEYGNGGFEMWRNIIVTISTAALTLSCAAGDALETESSSEATPAATVSRVVTDADIPSDINHDSWARLPLPQRERMDEAGQRVYDMVRHPESRYADSLWGPVAMWLYSPQMIEHVFPASTYLRYGTEKDQRLTELTILATAREVRSQYEWSAHEPLAVQAGLEAEIIELVKQRAPLDTAGDIAGLGDLERTIVQFVREVVSDEQVSAPTFARARELLGDQGVMDLTGLIGYYNFVNITLKSFNLQLAPGRERLLPDLW